MSSIRFYFQHLARLDPNPSLETRVLGALRQEQARSLLFRKRIALVALIVSSLLFVGAVVSAGVTLVQSDFWTMLGLLFSDPAVMLDVAGDFFSVLLETLPLMSLLFLLAPLALSFWSAGAWLRAAGREPLRSGFGPALFAR